MKKYLNWYTVSRTLCGHPRTLSANRIPKKHEKAVNELLNAVHEWHDKYVK